MKKKFQLKDTIIIYGTIGCSQFSIWKGDEQIEFLRGKYPTITFIQRKIWDILKDTEFYETSLRKNFIKSMKIK